MSPVNPLHKYQSHFGPRALEVAHRAAGKIPAFSDRLKLVGLSHDESEAGTFVARFDQIPVMTKDSLPRTQRQALPFGGMIAEGAQIARIFASPGPIYEAQLTGSDPWRWAPALEACGIRNGDIVLNCFSYHLSPAGAMFDEACQAIGATVVPGGVGDLELQAKLIADIGITAFVGLPSYLSSLIERYDDLQLPRDRWAITKALVTAEPLPDHLRHRLSTRVPTVLMAYGTAECGLIGYEVAAGDGLYVPSGIYVEICDAADGQPVGIDVPGEVVVSVLQEEYPLIRFGTGDVSRWTVTTNGDLRLAGVLGRVGEAVKVRGMFIHPHQAKEVTASLVELGAERARFVVERANDKDVLRLDLMATGDADEKGLADFAMRRTRELLRVRPQVVLVENIESDSPVLVDGRDW